MITTGIGHNKIVNFRINKLTIQETGTYNQQFLRPWNTEIDYQVQNALTQALGNNFESRFRPEAMNPIASAFIQKQAAPEATIGIPNGWEERRIRFLLETQYEFSVGGSVKVYFLGYTDVPGVGIAGSIDPNMVFYVNSYVKTRPLHVNTPLGMQIHEQVSETKQVLHGSADRNIGNPSRTFGMRPQDLYRYFNNDLEILSAGAGLAGVQMDDYRTTISPAGALADRRNNVPSYFGCNVFNNLLSVSDRQNMGESSEAVVNSVIRGLEFQKDNMLQEPLFSAISNARGNVAVNGSFRYGDLLSIDPNTSVVTNYIVVPTEKRAQFHQAGQTSHWQGSDAATRAAATLAHSVPALMMENMITRIVFKSSNYEIGGRMNTQIIHGNGFSAMDMRTNYDNFRNSFETLVLSQMTFNNSLTYALEMNVDLLGETWIKITIDNCPFVDYVTPSFSDSLFSPLVSSNAMTVASVASDFKCLYETINETPSYQSPQQVIGSLGKITSSI